MSESVKAAIHTLSSVLEIPAIIILMIAVAIVVIELGSLVVEIFNERRRASVDVPELIDEIVGKDRAGIAAVIAGSTFMKSKKRAFALLLAKDLPEPAADALASRLISQEELRTSRILQVTDIIARIAPMFGLMATLIPLGPGLIALGQGDTQLLSQSLLTAFDATIAGLASAGVAYIISRIRKHWYEGDIVAMETVTEVVLSELYDSADEAIKR
jgi:biopolymer transport protein ExbB/TolQ